MKISEILNALNLWAPPSYQESYDNATLIVGDKNANLTAALITLDCTESVVQEAIDIKANLIIAHHPIVFKGLKSLTGKNYVERTVLKAIKNDIAIFAIHTNLDNVNTGVNKKIADIIGLEQCNTLAPKSELLTKLVTFVPTRDKDKVLSKLFSTGAGQIGNYDQCSFQVEGKGTFRPNNLANPYSGQIGELHEEEEIRIEVMFPSHLQLKITQALIKSHPYEEVAYYLSNLKNVNQEVGSGMIGQLPIAIPTMDFLSLLKKKFKLKVIKHTAPSRDEISTVAICGGAGSFLLSKAKAQKADIFITGDFKYHEFFDAEDQIMIADIGHYESEVFTKELIYDFLKEKFPNIALNLSKLNTNPVNYF